jgi:hypothetical protein
MCLPRIMCLPRTRPPRICLPCMMCLPRMMCLPCICLPCLDAVSANATQSQQQPYQQGQTLGFGHGVQQIGFESPCGSVVAVLQRKARRTPLASCAQPTTTAPSAEMP